MLSKNILMNLSIITAVSISGCSAQQPRTTDNSVVNVKTVNGKVLKEVRRVSYGKASWYGKKFEGRKTASGEPFRVNRKTAAHKLFPFGTVLRVTNLSNKRSVIVRVNDRGPYAGNRIIDLSQSAANNIGLIKQGIAEVKVEIVDTNSQNRKLVTLPSSNQRCETDDCKSSIVKPNRSSSTIKPFAVAKVNKYPASNSSNTLVYGEELMAKAPAKKSYSSKSNRPMVVQNHYSPPKMIKTYPKVSSYNHKASVQIGAFRNRDGAKTCASRFSLLDRQYKAIVKNGTLNTRPIYRVQIDGFSSESEARRFISKHKNSLSGAFLVRR